LKDINELKAAYQDKINVFKKKVDIPVPGLDGVPLPTNGTPPAAPSASASSTSPSAFPPPPPPPQPVPDVPKSKIKTLHSYLNVDKIRELPEKEIEVLWRLRHAKNPQSLCAIVPVDAHKTIERNAKKHPLFILPLPREGQGAEIHLLQWTFPQPDTVTVLFTHLAEYKLRGEYSQPHTTITHHLELAKDKGLVFLQGQVLEGRGVTVDEAKWLLMCLQKFYGTQGQVPERQRLLELFGKGDPAFNIEQLVEEAEKAV
jgi:ATP synthase F1 complex assembly factor 1